MRAPALIALSLLALLTPTSATYATDAPATCLGQTATIVGGDGQVTGTDGPDVIVVGGSSNIEAHGGDDVICIRDGASRVDAGDGDDVVSSEDLAAGWDTLVMLGPGADRFRGGGAQDEVYAAQPNGDDTDPDDISTGEGDDEVYSGGASTVNADVVLTGSGDDTVVMVPPSLDGVLDGGSGFDAVSFNLATTVPTDWTIDLADQTVERGTIEGSWGATESMALQAEAGTVTAVASTLAVRGTDAPDLLWLLGGGLDSFAMDVRLRGGHDTLILNGRNQGSSRYALGGGSDSFVVAPVNASRTWFRAGQTVRVDLSQGWVDYGAGTSTSLVTGAEDVTAYGTNVRVAGDERTNHVTVGGCDVRVRAGDGKDRVFRQNLSFGGCSQTSSIDGGPGADQLVGGDKATDHLIGGPGRDTADGRGGTDTCRAEITRHCESWS